MARDRGYGNVTIDKKSYKELRKSLEKLHKVSEAECYRAVVETGMGILNQAKLNLKGKHVITSRLMNSIYLKQGWKRNAIERKMPSNYSWTGGSGDRDLNVVLSRLEIAVGTNVEYAGDVEFGTKPHVIEAKNGKSLSFKKDGKNVFAKKVNHPGTKGVYFLTNAAKNAAQLANDAIARAARRIEEATAI